MLINLGFCFKTACGGEKFGIFDKSIAFGTICLFSQNQVAVFEFPKGDF